MKSLALTVVLALATALGASAASAASTSNNVGAIGKARSGPILVRDDDHHDGWKHRRHWRHDRGRHEGWDNDRYRGWHRYHARPWNWRARGCVVLGPVWVCP